MKRATLAEAMELRKRAEADMRNLGFDPGSDLDWKGYALGLKREQELDVGRKKPGDDDIIEIKKRSYDRLLRIALPTTRLIAALKRVNKAFLSLPRRDQQTTLEHAIVCLELIEEIWGPLDLSRWGGLPEPLRLVLADLINARQGRPGRLVSPEFCDPRTVTDSSRDRFRVVVKANAAAVVCRLMEKGMSCAAACRSVAKALEKAGQRVPGKSTPYGPETIRLWHRTAQSENCPFAHEYEQALKASDSPPEVLLEFLAAFVRDHTFSRD